LGREIFGTNQVWRNRVAVGGQIGQQPSEPNQVGGAAGIVQWRLLFAQPTEPAKEMGIAAELREPVELWESGAEIG
jgi:hypothetical protein